MTCSESGFIASESARGSFSRILYCRRQRMGFAVEQVASRPVPCR